MARISKYGLRTLIVLIALALAGVAVRYFTRPAPVAVVLVPVERGEVETTVSNTRAGTVKACRRSRLAPAIGGQVAQLSVREGDRVDDGQILMVIWNEDLEARVQLAASEELAASARVQEACLNAEVAEREAERQQRLARQRLVAEEIVDRATTEAKARAAACQAARAAREVARANTTAARANLARTVLRAPFDGVVAEVNAELGEFVTPSPPGIPTPPAVDLIDYRCLYVAAPIDEVDAPAIRTGMTACVSLDAFPERRCQAKVRRIAPYVLDVEKQARTVEVEVEFAGETDSADLLPGYTADVEIVLERRDNVLRVPTETVLEGSRVLVYREPDGMLESRRFERGLSNWRYTQVLSGLGEGEKVVLSVDREGVEAGARATPEATQAAPGG
ncbi:MAG: efflux RND transporter periplasmic adaptor subunit [Gammaproteobacteria bacterium]|nr:efflux RND transporter periplasmic adaptor subunit [Gammaproteobacteria bacterium]NIM74221.1 efflux RND transporter periplasmic adaptor subunit [Gammaproteobacteria bacterium]NIN39520.1 efflux RND transporter periplasmic adaptor subunit [Gammaproteobacteria bacterium]NIO25993.1 efflux RND transporter periplasmic adaptor subunit [Gammaproteobacteria bacterium]NIO66626.1 efflux RND transporter periplasmic adaptor subunit [Gammaproteobacteria bacterium]